MNISIENYKHSIGSHCSSTLMKNMLNFNGIKISEELCFGIGAGLGFIYRKAFNPPYYFVLGRSDDLEEKICYFLGGEAIPYKTDDNKRAWEIVKESLKEGQPALVNVDAACLPYLKEKFDIFDNVRYGGHRVLVTGFDEEKGTVELADYLWANKQVVSMKELEEARSSPAGQTPPGNLVYRFKFPKEYLSLEYAIRSGIYLNQTAMLNPWYEVLGYSGLEKFCQRVTSWNRFMKEEMATTNAYMTYMMMEEVGTGGGNFRRLYSRFLREAEPILKDKRVGEAAAIYADLGKKWREVAHLLLEGSKDINTGIWNGAQSTRTLLDEISKNEKKALLILQEISYR